MSTVAQYALTWDLDSLYPHPEKDEFKKIFDEYKKDLKQLADDSESLPAIAPEVATVWADFLDRVVDVFGRSSDLNAFIGCHAAADAGNKLFQQMEASLAALGPLSNQVFTNVESAFRDLSDEQLNAFAEADERLANVKFFLEECRSNVQLRLPKDLEMLAAELGVDGIHAWGRMYERISGALRVELMEKGEIVKKSPGQVRVDLPDRKTRQNNFYAIEKAWNTQADNCADALNHIAGTRLAKYRRLGVEDHLTVPLRYNRMRRETLNTMWDVITNRKEPLLRYFERKAQLLGVEKMAWYDQLAPIPQASQGAGDSLSYDDACNTVIKTFHGFSGHLGDFAEKALNEGWVEVEDREGKRQGGFCTGMPTKKQSRIFMTYKNSADDMSTLAHELGHAYHSHVLREQPFLLQDYPMNLAETASTFAEAVLGDQRLAEADSPAKKLGILNNMLSDSVAFMMNIHARFIFENQFHVERAEGELSAERLTAIMLDAQKEAYCDSFEDWSNAFWISKLHFYITGWPFYNFPYTFGYLLSLGVYSTADEFGDDFPTKYRELLIATGCMNAEEAVQSTLGYDLTQPEFWNKSIDIIDSRVEEFLKVSEDMI
ncbi:M3 family oligoendopeptidase [Thalassoglobus polymorphus]|uniref:Oligoendopeptidase F, plasmid n=1 Tax=Thalassoglobus polymorphus TaxID=2527994 RepID=A0A517QLH2_9PLAN|nr:M3 family oligoendopeptidase [Thalassoglobus polymorphus]QDT32500.1 Oligoendopeptidase F, plasmid [Thalassoglobus polymorphus]